MKQAYPIVMTQEEDCILVYVPDFDINTAGEDIPDAIYMARDAIGAVGIVKEDEKQAMPTPSVLADVRSAHAGAVVTLVDVDFAEYRRRNDLRTVKKNCTLPSWLCFEAEKAGINFSAILQSALKNELRLDQPKTSWQ